MEQTMPTPQTQTIFKGIVDVLESIKKRDRRQTFRFGRYKKQAEALLQVSPAQGYTLLGILACLEHDIEAMHLNHKRAIAYHSSYETLSNYSASLDKSCLWRASFDLALAASDAEPADKAALRFAMTCLSMSGKFSLAETLSARWAKVSKGEADPLAWVREGYQSFCTRNNITEEDIQQMLDVVESTLSATDAIISSYASSFVSDNDGNQYLYYELTFQKDDDTFHYESLLDEAISTARLHDNLKDKIIFCVTGGESGELLSILEQSFTESDLVELDEDKIQLAKQLVEGVSF
jgi:hypothetical protein